MKYFLILFSIVFTSMFFFPFEFTFLRGVNTKHMMACIGIVCLGWDIISHKSLVFSRELLISSVIAIIFSLVGYYSTVYNNTSDYAYSLYIGSMWMWYLSCYGVCSFIKITHDYISLKLIVNYLAAVCVAQCAIAICIDFIPAFKSFVDSVFVTGDLAFMEEIGRLYGIGAALDVGGVRFASVLVMIAVFLSDDKLLRSNLIHRNLYIISFLIITVVGNMVARTTSLGVLLGLAYILFFSGLFSFAIKMINIRFWQSLIIIMIVSVTTIVYLYQTNKEVYELLRFAFEGFFNLIETGKWETSSTEVLKNMWIFPESVKTWIIGDGYFNNPITGGFYMRTDVGYLRFIFYCGLIGVSVFCIFFIYLSISLGNHFYYVRNMFFLLLVIVFANWVKVATDIFLVYAFFLVVAQPYFDKSFRKDFEKI